MRAFLLFALIACSCFADTITGRVVGIHDGDTITVLTVEKVQVKVRLWGIDAPELGQAFGKASREALEAVAAGKAVSVDVRSKDRYGRNVGVVTVGNVDANLAQVAGGWAWWYRAYAKKAVDLEKAETAARAAKVGLWVDKAPVAPWDWRKAKKQK